MFILGWAELNHQKMTQFLQGIKAPQPFPPEAILIDPSFKLVEPSNSESSRGYYITNSSEQRYYNPLFFKKFNYLQAPSANLPLGFVSDLISNPEPKFRDCLCLLSLSRKGSAKSYTVNLGLANPDGTCKQPWDTEEFKRRYLDQIPALKKLLHKAEQEINSAQNNEAFFERLRRSHGNVNDATLNAFADRPSFNMNINDDQSHVLKGADKKTPRIELDDLALLFNTAEYSGLQHLSLESAKRHLRSQQTA